ncbi:MAG: SLATT domain-containing protein [Acidobacteria bacterium]|nr:SLATT domain-containing protein [Acidobacteriota bacterium]
MFQLSLVDHIRLSFAHVVCSQEAHARLAEQLSVRAWWTKLVTMVVLGLATAACLLALETGRSFQTAAAVLAASAFVLYGVSLTLDFEPRVYAHRSCAARLWLLAEKYRALLAEVHDGLIDHHAVTERRDALMREVQAVYEQAPPADIEAYQIARKAVSATEQGNFSEAEIDQMLPVSLRQAGKAST